MLSKVGNYIREKNNLKSQKLDRRKMKERKRKKKQIENNQRN